MEPKPRIPKGMVGKRCMAAEGVAEAYPEAMRVTMQA